MDPEQLRTFFRARGWTIDMDDRPGQAVDAFTVLATAIAPPAGLIGLPQRDDLADAFCYLRRHDHVEDLRCEASSIEADHVVRALSARYDYLAGRRGDG